MGRRAPNHAGTVVETAPRRWQGFVMVRGKRYAVRATTYELVREKLDAKIAELTGGEKVDLTEWHEWQRVRTEVLKRDGRRCRYCGGEANGIDHIVPRSAGGPHTLENVVACCNACNVRKGAHLPPNSPATTATHSAPESAG